MKEIKTTHTILSDLIEEYKTSNGGLPVDHKERFKVYSKLEERANRLIVNESESRTQWVPFIGLYVAFKEYSMGKPSMMFHKQQKTSKWKKYVTYQSLASIGSAGLTSMGVIHYIM